MKKIIKIIFQKIIKTHILFHRNRTSNLMNYNEALQNINTVNKMDKYCLKNKVIKINNSNVDLSIIVPVYNAEIYLKKCLDSLINQNTHYKYEIICVNDGSSDNSLNILSEYKNIILINQDNKGISNARNIGLNSSMGKYVSFVDNDDYVDNNYVQKLLDAAYEYDADYVKCGYKVIDNNKKEIDSVSLKKEIVHPNDKFNLNTFSKGYMWGGCYKRNLWVDFCFPEGCWYEDIVKTIYIYDKCSILVNIEDILYIKNEHGNNAAHNVWKTNNIKCLDHIKLVYTINELKKDQKINNTFLGNIGYINELGEYLYKRVHNLDNYLVKSSFVIASEIVKEHIIKINKEDSYLLYYANMALVNKDYTLWKLVGFYSRCC